MSRGTRRHADNPVLARWADRGVRGRAVRVALAEGDDARVWEAAPRLVELGIEPVVLVEKADVHPPRGVEVVETATVAAGVAGTEIERLAAARGSSPQELENLLASPVYLGAAMLKSGMIDACVAGNLSASGDVIRAGVRVLGVEGRDGLVSSSFLLVLEGGVVMAFGDCAVVPEPDASQLAQIAAATSDTFAQLTGETPRVAMLSFSTMGSARHESVTMVREATELARELRPGLAVDGEFQFDAAFVPAVAALKAPGSSVAGSANVFIFPSLAAGNIGYKIAERLGGAQAFGPVLQGLTRPLNDLSRGCSADDIVNVSVISALQALDSGVAAPEVTIVH